MTGKTSRRAFLQGGVVLATLPHLPAALLAQPPGAREELWYNQPAQQWLGALPVGNGFLGGMVYGGIQTSASHSPNQRHGRELHQPTRSIPVPCLTCNKCVSTSSMASTRSFSSCAAISLPGHAKNFGTNLPLPEVQFAFDEAGSISEYRRSLNLDTAIATVRCRRGNATYIREVFASHPDRILTVRLTCNKPRSISFRLSFGKSTLPGSVVIVHDTLVFQGHAYEHMHSSGRDGVVVHIHARAVADGGTVTPSTDAIDIHGASSVTVFVAIATSFHGADPASVCRQRVDHVATIPYARLRQTHVADHQSLYRRVSLDLGESSAASRQLPTNERRKALERNADQASDPQLLALFFQYGRYLTIAGSRADSPLPLALQGIWNDGLASSMGWTDDFHLDIDTQQNYWPAEGL